MNKDFEQKNDAVFHSAGLRRRISDSIKSLRDQGEETKQPQTKTFLLIPVTGSNMDKYQTNKRRDEDYKF